MKFERALSERSFYIAVMEYARGRIRLPGGGERARSVIGSQAGRMCSHQDLVLAQLGGLPAPLRARVDVQAPHYCLGPQEAEALIHTPASQSPQRHGGAWLSLAPTDSPAQQALTRQIQRRFPAYQGHTVLYGCVLDRTEVGEFWQQMTGRPLLPQAHTFVFQVVFQEQSPLDFPGASSPVIRMIGLTFHQLDAQGRLLDSCTSRPSLHGALPERADALSAFWQLTTSSLANLHLNWLASTALS